MCQKECAEKSYKIVRLFSVFESGLKESCVIIVIEKRRLCNEYYFKNGAFMQILWLR